MRRLSNTTRVKPKQFLFDETAPITHSSIDGVYIFYTPNGRLVKSKSYDEAHAKWLLTKEAD